MAKQPFKFLVCVPEWDGDEFSEQECHYDDPETAAEENIEERDDECSVVNMRDGIEVLVKRQESDQPIKLRVTAEARMHYTATEQ